MAPYERLRTASPGADINRQPLTFTPYVSTESLRGSGTLHFAQESPRVSPASALARNRRTKRSRWKRRSCVRASALEVATARRSLMKAVIKGDTRAYSRTPTPHPSRWVTLRWLVCGGVPQITAYFNLRVSSGFCCSCEQIFPPPRAASFLTMRWRDGGNLA